jgi:hypothetical protein
MSNRHFEDLAIDLLRYALQKSGVPSDRYIIGVLGDERKVDDRLCLLAGPTGDWTILYTERGSQSEKTVHQEARSAINDFFYRLVRQKDPWSFREAWEADTGQAF